MIDKYIPLRINRDFGDIITAYFDFLKSNLKKFTNIFISYNGIGLIFLLIVSYLLVSGFIGFIAYESSYTYGVAREPLDDKYNFLMGFGAILLILVVIVVAALNYSLSSSYMILYQKNEGAEVHKKEVWKYTTDQAGNILLFIILLIALFLGLFIISFILLIIPFLGIFAYYIILFFFLSWIGVSFFHMLQEKVSVTDGLGEGWKLVTKNFWKSVGVNFVLGILNGVLQVVLSVIPFVLVGLYTFHVVENDVDFSSSVVAKIVYTLGTWLALSVGVYSYCLSQFVNGMLYYSLHEKEYNVNTRSKIDEIGNTAS